MGLSNSVLGMGGNGLTNINNSNSNITFTYGNVQITENNYCGDTRRIDLDVCKDTRGDILPPSKLFGETTARRNMEEIWGLIIGDTKKIGVYGMGGIGKTTVMKHINNRILEEKNDKFDCIIWVTVSKESSIFKLQHDIAHKIDVNLSNDEDPTKRAVSLFKALKQKGRYLLILDDLWKGYPLEDVGIPDPYYSTSSNTCKLVLTTRSLDVCQSMKFEAIKMDLLSEDEAWSLFLHHVGHEVLHVKDLEPIARGVALECARLPLAIATIGRSMTGKKEICEWRNALAKLRAFSKEHGDEEKRVIEQLKFSFDCLENKKIQKCLWYCALYPEDYEIERAELGKLLTLERIIEEKESRMTEIDECNTILNKLINQCLLESGETSKGVSCVKMHDLVRDMTLQINDLHFQYLPMPDIETKKLIGRTILNALRELKTEFEDLNLEQNMEKCGMIFEGKFIEKLKSEFEDLNMEQNMISEEEFIEGFSNWLKSPRRTDVDVCEKTRCDMTSLFSFIVICLCCGEQEK